jgi:hypothetical protein
LVILALETQYEQKFPKGSGFQPHPLVGTLRFAGLDHAQAHVLVQFGLIFLTEI